MKKYRKERKIRCAHLSGHLQIDEMFSDFYSVTNGVLDRTKISAKEFIVKNRQFVCSCGAIIKNLRDEKLQKLVSQL